MTKRQMPDLSKLLTANATPMADAAEPPVAIRAANDRSEAAAAVVEPRARRHQAGRAGDEAATANLENLNFKVPKSFRKRFRDCAYRADLKHNELLFAALDAWESLQGKN
jgi:hypothetical protein